MNDNNICIQKDEAIRLLKLLSVLDGFIIGKVGVRSLPDYVSEELEAVSEYIAFKIQGLN